MTGRVRITGCLPAAVVLAGAVVVMTVLGVSATSLIAGAFTPQLPRTEQLDRPGTAGQPPRSSASTSRVVAGAADTTGDQLARRPPPDLKTVIGNITRWLVGMLVAVATLFLTIGGIRYLFAGGDPGEVAKAKDTLKYAGIGYCIAVLAPVLVKILQGFVGAS